MKVISVVYKEKKNAGPKAPSDIDKILIKEHKADIISVIRTGNYKMKILFNFIKLHFSKDYIILQHPVFHKESVYNILPKDKTIVLIHDINGLRNQKEETLNKEINIFKKFKYIIVHNNKMKEYLVSKGIKEENLYVLELFDYLANGNIKEDYTFNKNDIKLIYPGNLKKEKSPFIYQLDSNKLNFKINLYGIGIDKDISDKLIYKGSFEPDEINDLEGDIGLIWDGNYDESDEDIWYKNYTKYNNPHKLSCCMAMGIPVIVWEKAAIADFVKENNVGYTIRNIYDINNLDFSNYDIKRKNAIEIGKKVRDGYYTKRVIKTILEKIK